MNRRNRRQQEEEDSKSAEQAEEVRGEEEEEPEPISDEDGENLEENADRDYERIEELDQYERESADAQEHDVDQEARQRAEQELADRDRRKTRDQRRDQLDVEPYLDDDDREYQLRVEQRQRFFREDIQEEDFDEPRFLDVEQARGRLSEWIKEPQTMKFIRSKFTKFLRSYQGEANFPIYSAAIREMCTSNRQSIEISYDHIKAAQPTLAVWIAMEPLHIFPYLNLTAYKIACKNYPSYERFFAQVFVKIKDLTMMDYIRELRYTHLNKLVHVTGVITKRSVVFSQLKKITYKCSRCGQLKGEFFVNNFQDRKDIKLGQCTSCQSNGPFLIEKSRTIYRNYQVVTIQESPAEVPAGRIPRQKEVVLLADNIDVARPGDEVDLIGVYMNKYSLRLNVSHGFPVFSTMIEANHIRRVEDDTRFKAVAGSDMKFQQMKKDKDLVKKLINSVAPNIYGHEDIKMAILLAMFGGVETIKEDTHRVRGDINVLVMGDPGTAKSQFLKSVQHAFYRCIYTTGKGASAVGLTASVKRDFATNEWVLEAGALVLADKGICLIDEFDKMNEKDRTSIHEAMEQQSISISKAGIVTSLRARCSVIAAANPIQGRYNSQLSFRDNVDLTDPILSRFDILCVVKDDVDEQIDFDLSTFVINQHMKTHPIAKKYNVINQLLEVQEDKLERYDLKTLKNYIKFARENCTPTLNKANTEMIKQFYVQLREESNNQGGGINIAVRHIESLIRMSVAHAKMHLRPEVRQEDVKLAIRVMLRSFVQSQKHSLSKLIQNKFKEYL